MVKQYVEKPQAVEAVQYDGTNAEEVIAFADNRGFVSDGRLVLDMIIAPVEKSDFVIKDGYKLYALSESEFNTKFKENEEDRSMF